MKKAAKKRFKFVLYVASLTSKSLSAFKNLNDMCEENLAGEYEIEVINILTNPKIAVEENIVAIPTLVKRRPKPQLRVIGDLSDTQRILAKLRINTAAGVI